MCFKLYIDCAFLIIEHSNLLKPNIFFSLSRFVSSNLDKTWFPMSANRNIIEAIIEVQAKATDCDEYRKHCQKFLEKDVIPPNMIDFWYHGSRTSIESINNQFILDVRGRMQDVLSGKCEMLTSKKPKIPIPDASSTKAWEKDKQITSVAVEPWSLAAKEKENRQDFTPAKFFPMVSDYVDVIFHALTTQIAFDFKGHKSGGEFALHPSVQAAVNNRDVDVEWVSRKNYNGGMDAGMFEFVTNQPGTENLRDERWNLSEGHYILVSRVRRQNAPDGVREILAPYTHMMEIQTTSVEKSTRQQGIKTLGDHVGVACSLQTVADLYKVLTVSRTCDLHAVNIRSLILRIFFTSYFD